ncbi:TetR/AcrR family transcriptional regulator [Treponema sp. OMZ 840]|uniref:TetR/AcrR family transcriptional regulator n=1 Tax=Treponema sp. OMZ 840 TaxID=244313 RepID=UPI003D8F3175
MSEKKDAGKIRQNQLIDAAASLFFSKGYINTSVRDILDTANDRTSSPSVFYYYFKSKEEIYRAVLRRYTERYIQAVQDTIDAHKNDAHTLMAQATSLFLKTVKEDVHGKEAASSPDNLLYALKLKEELTQKFVEVWEIFIRSLSWYKADAETVHKTAVFIAGGIGEMMYDFGYVHEKKDGNARKLMDSMIDFCARVLNAPAAEKEKYRRLVYDNLTRTG